MLRSRAENGEEEEKGRKKATPQAPTTLDAILAQCGFYLHPITHKHPNVTLLLRAPFEFDVIMNVKGLCGGSQEGAHCDFAGSHQIGIFYSLKGDVFFC